MSEFVSAYFAQMAVSRLGDAIRHAGPKACGLAEIEFDMYLATLREVDRLLAYMADRQEARAKSVAGFDTRGDAANGVVSKLARRVAT